MTLVAFTALETKPLYQRDAFNILALPEGWNVRWSYRDEWVSSNEDVRGELRSNSLVGQSVLIVLCGNADSKTGEFSVAVPIRWGTVTESRLSSDPEIFHLSIVLGALVSQDVLTSFCNQKGTPKLPRLREGAYLLRSDELSNPSAQALPWRTLVEEARRIKSIEQALFFQIRGIRRRPTPTPIRTWIYNRHPRLTPQPPNRPVPLFPTRDPKGLNQLDLFSGAVYELEIHVDAESMERDRTPVLVTIKGGHLSISEPLSRQHGSGAVVMYLLAVERKYVTELSTLKIRGSGDAADGPEVQALVSMGPTRSFWPLTIVGLFLGWTLIETATAPFLAGSPYLGLAFQLAGAALIMSTAWFAFRRLPIKV